MFDIRWDQAAKEDMERMKLRAYDVGQIVDAVAEQLTHQPERESKRKKVIRPGEQLPFEHAEPVWQLRVGEFRVFYDVSKQQIGQEADKLREHEGVVAIRAVRRKPGHKTTRGIP
jgi:mRNA-degrading endonuclease RelE of RelBE toxin-antitoxin system